MFCVPKMLRLAAFAALCLSTSALAEEAPVNGSLTMVTGPTVGTYYKIGQDIAKVAASSKLTVDVKESGGSVANIERMSSKENANLGIVQSDVLGFLKRTGGKDGLQSMTWNLRMVFPLYNEEVHIFAPKSISQFEDLKGKRIIVGDEGSGSWVTANNLLAMTKIKPGKTIKMDPAEGVAAVMTGKADALVFVAGKPVKLFKNIEDLKSSNNAAFQNLANNFHFLPLIREDMLKEYAAAEITPQDYSFLSTPVPTIAVTAVLVSYDFSGKGGPVYRERCAAIKTLSQAIRLNMKWLGERGHPKWREVNPDAEVTLWKRDNCAVQPVVASAQENKPETRLEKELLNAIQKRW